MKYSRKFSIQFYLVVGAVLGCLGGGLVWKVTHVVLQETSFNLSASTYIENWKNNSQRTGRGLLPKN